jgi:hypothetical protein
MAADAYTREEIEIAQAINGVVAVLHVVREPVAQNARN